MDAIKIYKSRHINNTWIAEYTTLDIVSQGPSKRSAIKNLLDCIVIHIDYAVKNGNLGDLSPPEPVNIAEQDQQ